jgi:hypothetical protein
MTEEMTKTGLLQRIHSEWARWERALSRVPTDVLGQTYLAEGMSLKDIIAHIAWYDLEMVHVASERALAGSEWWEQPLDERNATIYAANRDRSLADVQEEAQQAHAALLAALEALEDADLNDARRFRDMPVDWLPWQVIASNTFEHYSGHAADLETWLARPKS